ncbi:MAG: multinuclear nonheme iron-dependent oxidase [Nitrospiraceae bacterium]
MPTIEHEFRARASRIPRQGVGLSVDVYTPDLFELVEALDDRRLEYGYLEIFKASQPAFAEVRRRLPHTRFQYHAEGLWVTQPGLELSAQFETALATAAGHLATLDCDWVNHECAAKQMAGYSFGTYLPPLFTNESADLVAENASLIQRRLGTSGSFLPDGEPLLLIEIPPLTYFGVGELPIADFFRRITAQVSCGLVLDVGHIWTVYRYTGEWRRRPVTEFLRDFLDTFPLERVIQIHLAGLDVHRTNVEHAKDPERQAADSICPPLWIDTHGAPIPEVLWDMLAQVVSHPRLIHLKGMALEVDTKSVPQIVTEFDRFRRRFGEWFDRLADNGPVADAGTIGPASEFHVEQHEKGDVAGQYDRYARMVGDQSDRTPPPRLPLLGTDHESLDLYRRRYLPHEILTWGGDLREMFPETCRYLDDREISLSVFVQYWFREPRTVEVDYDFFLLKLDWFVEFVKEVLPDAGETAAREAEELRSAYQAACEPAENGVPRQARERAMTIPLTMDHE